MSNKSKSLWRLITDSANSRVVNSFALLALVVIVLVRTFNLDTLFTGAAEIGSALDGLALAYATAWFFNLLVIETPRQRDEAQNFEIAATTLRSLSGVAQSIANDVTGATDSAPRKVGSHDVDDVVGAFAQLAPYGPSPVASPNFEGGAVTIGHLTWIQYFVDQKLQLSIYQSRLDPRLHLLNPTLVGLYAKVTDHSFWLLVQLTQRAPMKNPNLEFMGGTFGELMKCCLKLQAEVDRCEAHYKSA